MKLLALHVFRQRIRVIVSMSDRVSDLASSFPANEALFEFKQIELLNDTDWIPKSQRVR